MTDALASLGLPELVAGAMMLALNAYVLMGGADFGGGVWDLLAHGSRGEAQRALVADAIGPIWEANHVWLIVVVVLLFTAFPTVYAALGIVLHIPLSLMLVGIVLRGSAFVFRSYGSAGDAPQRRWGRVFAIASTITPVLLGVIIGAIASGAVGAAAARIRDGGAGADPASFATLYVAPWLTPFALAVGAQALALFAFLAAVYLTLAAGDDAVREDFRRRALAAAAAVLVTAVATAWLAASRAPLVGTELVAAPWALLLQVATGAAALSAIWALWTRRWALARLAAAAQVSCILWGWALVQYPFLIPPTHTIRGAAAPRITLQLVLWTLVGGSIVLLPSLAYLFRTFAASQGSSSPATPPRTGPPPAELPSAAPSSDPGRRPETG